MDWQPIETAPKNERIFVWSKTEGAWPGEWQDKGDYGPGWYPGVYDRSEGYWGIDDATHWARIVPPSPPLAPQ